jgi:hypothetical protein
MNPGKATEAGAVADTVDVKRNCSGQVIAAHGDQRAVILAEWVVAVAGGASIAVRASEADGTNVALLACPSDVTDARAVAGGAEDA